MKTRVFNLIILDESGSMCSIEKEAVDGVNETIQTIRSAGKKHEDQEHFLSLVTFNSDEIKTVYECVQISEISDMTSDQFNPNCCTPLYDAMGKALAALKRKVAQDDRVLVTVITDGMENASREFSGSDIKHLVEKLKKEGWVFAYIGTDHDVHSAAASISITNTMVFHKSVHGTMAMNKKQSKSRARFYDKLAALDYCSDEANMDFFKED